MGKSIDFYVSEVKKEYTITMNLEEDDDDVLLQGGGGGLEEQLRLTQNEVDDLREAFDLFDVDRKGTIYSKDLADILREILFQDNKNNNNTTRLVVGLTKSNHHHNKNRKNADLTRLIETLSTRQDDDVLNFDSFVSLFMDTKKNNAAAGKQQQEGDDDNNDMQRVFNLFDTDGKGYIDIDDLREVAAELGETSMAEEELQEMIQRSSSSPGFDINKVTYEDFCSIMTKKLFS